MRRGEVFEHLRELQKQGKIKAFGASVESMDEALVCLEQEGMASLQIIFNIFRQKPIDVLFPEGEREGRGDHRPPAAGQRPARRQAQQATASSPNATTARSTATAQAFNVGETFAGLPFEKGVDLADALKPLVPAGMTMAQFALRWCLDFDAVTTVIPGASRAEQARANAAVSALPPLSPELHANSSSSTTTKSRPHPRAVLKSR